MKEQCREMNAAVTRSAMWVLLAGLLLSAGAAGWLRTADPAVGGVSSRAPAVVVSDSERGAGMPTWVLEQSTTATSVLGTARAFGRWVDEAFLGRDD